MRGAFLGVALLSCVWPASARVLVVGDSNATGTGVPAMRAWPMRLARDLNMTVQVFGTPGTRFVQPLGMSDAGACEWKIRGIYGLEAAVLALGTNDFASDPVEVAAGARKLLTALPGTRWICVTPPPRSTDIAEGLTAVRAAIRTECEAVGAVVIEGTEVLRERDLAPDGVHWNAGGHLRMARAVRRAVLNVIGGAP